jgi:hypothetical protein
LFYFKYLFLKIEDRIPTREELRKGLPVSYTAQWLKENPEKENFIIDRYFKYKRDPKVKITIKNKKKKKKI